MPSPSRTPRLATIALALAFVASFSASAQAATGVNKTIPYAGYLKDSTTGNAAPNGTYSIVFKLYDVASGGTALWSETQSGITITNGTFAVVLGSVTAFPAGVDFNTDSLYLTMAVNGGSETTPRLRLGSAPYSMNADTTDGIHLTSGTAGYLPKYGTGGTIIGGNSSLYDDSAGKIGIGTASPGQKLSIGAGSGAQTIIGFGLSTTESYSSALPTYPAR